MISSRFHLVLSPGLVSACLSASSNDVSSSPANARAITASYNSPQGRSTITQDGTHNESAASAVQYLTDLMDQFDDRFWIDEDVSAARNDFFKWTRFPDDNVPVTINGSFLISQILLMQAQQKFNGVFSDTANAA